jgi:Mg2+/Co2+ transporter CorB
MLAAVLTAALGLLLAAWSELAAVALFTANRFRLRHLARGGSRGARDADELLARPDRLAALLALLGAGGRVAAAGGAFALGHAAFGAVGGWGALLLAALALALLANLLPRALAAPRPERYARRTAPLLRPLLLALGPLADALLLAHRGLARATGAARSVRTRSLEELAHAKPLVAGEQRRAVVDDLMLLSATVADAMVPRAEVVGLDVDAEWDAVVHAIETAPHRALPVYRGSLDQPLGMLTVRRALALLRRDALDRAALIGSLSPNYFVPLATPLQSQLVEFQRAERDVALVVDEYGAIQGLVAMADVVAELAAALVPASGVDPREARPDRDGAYLVGGSTQLRTLNRSLGWDLPIDGPRTINGLLLEHLESIPAPGTTARIAGYTFEVLQVGGSAVKTVRISPPAAPGPAARREAEGP